MSNEEWAEFQKLAAQQARACEIIIAADKLALTADRILEEDLAPGSIYIRGRITEMRAALDAFKVVRQGT